MSELSKPFPLTTAPSRSRVALVWRGDPAAPPPAPDQTRLHLIFEALAELDVDAEPVLWADEAAAAIGERLARYDGVLVWVDPISDGKDRSRLNPVLRAIAAGGTWVSAHPDVIAKMGVKEVLHRTRELGWSGDVDLYRTADDLRARFPVSLAAAGPRVLKQNRGNGGLGVWKVALVGPPVRGAGPETLVEVLHAQRGSAPRRLPLGAFMDECEPYFARDGLVVDQAFQPRLPEGMIRCYLSEDRVVGLGHQLIKALVTLPPGAGPEAATPGPRIMHPPETPAFLALRTLLEQRWVPAMQALLQIETGELPALWDADFLLGRPDDDGHDTYVLCEINVSAVAPYPDTAAPAVARTVARHLLAGVKQR